MVDKITAPIINNGKRGRLLVVFVAQQAFNLLVGVLVEFKSWELHRNSDDSGAHVSNGSALMNIVGVLYRNGKIFVC